MTPQLHHSISALVLLALIGGQALAQSASDARFNRFDKNADGKLTADELPYPVVFKQLDTDGDGKLSPQEAEKIPSARAKPAPPSPPAAPSRTASPSAPLPESSVPRNDSAATPLARLAFTQDYFPGTRDANGRFLGGTEALWLAGHEGKLFAAIGYAVDRPGDDPKPGAQIIRKDAPDAPWVVDHGFGPNYLRVESLLPFTFTTDATGQPLAKPVRRLIASPSELASRTAMNSVFVRDDATGRWVRSDIAPGNFGARSIGSHVDKITGVHHIFVGLNRGGIHRGSYDPAAPGGIRWEAESERPVSTHKSRVLCFAVCNGDLHMAARQDDRADGQIVDGGLYRRVDGPKPEWKLVNRWPIDLEILQSRFLRGLTAVPDPQGGMGEVLIAGFEYPGTIVRFNPSRSDGKNEVAAELEIDIKDYFNTAWNTPTARRRGAIAAYNRFLPVTDPRTGEPLWLCGAWVERPGSPNPPHNGSCYLIRHRNGRYDWGYICDPAHPIAAGRKLTGCRDIEPSPFKGEEGCVFYFAGYDGGAGPGHNTAWIYRGEVPKPSNTNTRQKGRPP